MDKATLIKTLFSFEGSENIITPKNKIFSKNSRVQYLCSRCSRSTQTKVENILIVKSLLCTVCVKLVQETIPELRRIEEECGATILTPEEELIKQHDCVKFTCFCGDGEGNGQLNKIIQRDHLYCKSCLRVGKKYKTHQSFDEVKKEFEKAGCKLLSEEYTGAKEHLAYRCSKGHVVTTTFNRFKQGHRCPKCKIGTSITYETIKQYFEENNVIMVTTKKKFETIAKHKEGIKTENLTYLCKTCMGKMESLWHNISRKGWTGVCCACQHNEQRISPEIVYDYMLDNGCEWLNPPRFYTGINQELTFRCYCGEIGFATFKEFRKRGKRCENCTKERRVETSLEFYGVDNPAKNEEIKRKIVQNSYKKKNFVFPSGKTVKVRGYEPFAIKDLLEKEGYKEEDLVVEECDVKCFGYLCPKTKTERTYFPDICIPKEKTIVEIKSSWTYNINFNVNYAKWKAVHEAGYKMRIMIYHEKGTCTKDLTFENIEPCI